MKCVEISKMKKFEKIFYFARLRQRYMHRKKAMGKKIKNKQRTMYNCIGTDARIPMQLIFFPV